jgi:DNA-binding winged helix-turn-helix (wHTH) protein
MEIRRGPFSTPAVRDLTKISAFKLGALTVDPPTRQLRANAAIETIEPRMMHVLVTVGMQPGKVFSREDLIEECWHGVVVGDNAIDRVMSRLRRLLPQMSDGTVRLETITKVGFRLVVEASKIDSAPATSCAQALDSTSRANPAPSKLPSPADLATANLLVDLAPLVAKSHAPVRSGWTRRAAIAGAVVTVGTGAALSYEAWHKPVKHVPNPQALDLYQRGQTVQKISLPGGMRQAMSFYQQAIAIDPSYADAWAAMAIGYVHGGDGFIKEPRSAYPRLIRSAAGRALALDPQNAEARLALTMIYPQFRRWREHEARLRALASSYPDYWFTFGQLDLLLENVGRFEEAIVFRRRQLELEPKVPPGWAYLARALHYAGRDHEADLALDQAFARWPGHPILWGMRYAVLVGGKSYRDAAAFARDPRTLPEMFPKQGAELLAQMADALYTRSGMEGAISKLSHMPLNVDNLPFMIPLMAEFGDAALVFDRLDPYYFGGNVNGRPIETPGELDPRETAVLFAPAVLALRDDPRYGRLLDRVGLEEYWRSSGRRPDFRNS